MSSASFVPPRLQDDRLAFDISEVEKSLSKRIEMLKRRAAGCKDTDPRYLPCLLRFGGERRGKEATGDQRHEGAPPDRWFLPNAVSDSGAIRDLGQPDRVHAGALLTGWEGV
jgi:hypothetical protein